MLLLHFAPKLSEEIWMKTGTARQHRFIAIHEIKLDKTLQSNIPAYHAITGCDTVSQLTGHGKKTTWKVFQKHAALLDNLGHEFLSEATKA